VESLLLDWLDWMKDRQSFMPMSAARPTCRAAQDSVLDIAVLYAPKLLPGYKVELLVESSSREDQ
jgi:hypothetical protein